jgi:hypothetical protein
MPIARNAFTWENLPPKELMATLVKLVTVFKREIDPAVKNHNI